MTYAATINCIEYEYVAEPTDGIAFETGGPFWGISVKYRPRGTRHWKRLTLVDVHSWDVEAIVAAIDYQVTP